jgi:prolipoprotein diacylglyceryltransferase
MTAFNVSTFFGANYYMLFHIAAVTTCVVFTGIAAAKTKFGFREFAVIVSTGILGLIVGGKILSFDSDQWRFLISEGHLPAENGKSTLGALLGLMLGLWFSAKIIYKNHSILDLFAVSVPLGLAVQGFGCLSAGCCHGEVTNLPWGISYGPQTRIFYHQVHQGLIPHDATHSLAVHPSQLYTVIASLMIAFIVWKMRNRWKSASASFNFFIILYLVYRIGEHISSYSLPGGTWLGMPAIIVKILILIIFTTLLWHRERKYDPNNKTAEEHAAMDRFYDLKIILIALFTMTISMFLSDWLSIDEKTLLIIIIFPLCGLVLLQKLIETLVSEKYVKVNLVMILACILMSQKADIPPVTPDSYTSINLKTAFGKYDIEHLFNKEPQNDCDGDPYLSGDQVNYQHNYKIGGIGISRKKYYSKWESSTFSLNVLGGIDEATPIHNIYPDVLPPTFKSTIWAINPVAQYDSRGIGLGLGVSFGNVSFDREYKLENLEDYTPEGDGKHFALQTRFRFFSERLVFVEVLGGYDAGATGEFNWQGLLGSRFDSDKYMMQAGFAIADHSDPAFVIKGEFSIVPNLFFSPQIIYYQKKSYPDYDQTGIRAVMGLEYRFLDHARRK